MKRRRFNLPTGCAVILMFPVIIVTAPFVLTPVAVHERLQRCPNCKRRGTLERVHLEVPPDLPGSWRRGEPAASGENWQDTHWEDLRRINPESVVWECRVCG